MKKVAIIVLAVMVLASSTAAFAEDVYFTKNGKKYHVKTCPLIKNKGAEAISEKDAIENGLTPCKRCLKGKKLSDQSAKKAKELNLAKKTKKNKTVK